MEAREALVVLFRRWWLLLGLPVAVAILSLAMAQPAPHVYEARLRFVIDIPRSALVPGSDEGTAAKIGEALIDDIARIIPSSAFATAVAERLPPEHDVRPNELASELSATDRHRVADVWVRRALPQGASEAERALLRLHLVAIGEAAVAELEENGGWWFARLGQRDVALTVIDGPTVMLLPPSLRQRLDLSLRLALALVVAVGLVFVWHALDPVVHAEAEAADAAGAPVLGSIPARRRVGWPRR